MLDFNTIYRDYEPRIRHFLMRMVAEHDAVNDIVQETFMALLQHVGDPIENINAYLHAVARFKVLTHYQQSSRRNKRHAPLELAYEIGIECDPTIGLYAEEVLGAIEKLPPRHRQTMRAVIAFEGKVTDISRALKIPLNTAKTRKHYARKALNESFPR